MSTSPAFAAGAVGPRRFGLDRGWQLDEMVALRPERFGALAYHRGTRRLSFLKSRALLEVVGELSRHETALEACRAAGVGERDLPTYERALARLASTGMIRERRVA